MMLAIQHAFIENANSIFQDELEHFEAYLPKGVHFEDDIWDLHSWGQIEETRTRLRMDTSRIKHAEVRTFFKYFLLYRRKVNHVGPKYGHPHFMAAIAWSEHLGARDLLSTCGDDFYWIDENHTIKPGTLEQFAKSLNQWFGLVFPEFIKPRKKLKYGLEGTDKGRFDKLISEQVLCDLLSLRHKDDLSKEDTVMLNALAINLACGFRVGELFLLPKDCLVHDEGALYVRNFTSKGGLEAPRLVPSDLKEMVEQAVQHILELSEPGRIIARHDPHRGCHWERIFKDEDSMDYFLRLWLHEWTNNPHHHIIRKDAAWSQAQHRWVDALGAIEKHGSQRQAAKAEGFNENTFIDLVKQQKAAQDGQRYVRTNSKNLTQWKRDSRVVSPTNFVRALGYTHSKINFLSHTALSLIEKAAKAQISGAVYTKPQKRLDLEQEFSKTKPIRLNNAKGKPILFVKDMLFVFPVYGLSDANETKTDRWRFLEPSDLIQWLGRRRDRPSVFERHGIIDERTGKIASFKSHDIRHWLNTTYQKGGLSQGQISTLFNRHDTRGNSPYNHTSNQERRDRLKESIRTGFVGGSVADTYHRLSNISKEEAEAHLDAYTRQVNIMPHGLCTKDLASDPCPHHLSCFSCDDTSAPEEAKPCPFLSIDFLNPDTEKAIQDVQSHAKGMIDNFENLGIESGPQVTHFEKIIHSSQHLLTHKGKPS